MGNLIPEKTFDAQMHIIRDVHFDVDKYKVGELYVINLKDPAYLSVQDKTIAQLTEAKEHELKFKALALNYDPETGNSYNTYGIGGLRFTIDDIIDRRIEIERLLTETEAAVYLTSAFVKESANDLFNSQIDWQKEPIGADYFSTHEKYQYNQDGKLTRVPPKPDIQAAYKIDKDEAKELVENGPMKIVEDRVRKRYVTNFGNDGKYEEFIVGNRISVYAFHGLADCKRVNIRLVKGKSTIDINLSSNKLSFFEKSIHIGGGACSIDMELHVDSMRDMFDEIIFYAQQ